MENTSEGLSLLLLIIFVIKYSELFTNTFSINVLPESFFHHR
jgi:hypothetical protein